MSDKLWQRIARWEQQSNKQYEQELDEMLQLVRRELPAEQADQLVRRVLALRAADCLAVAIRIIEQGKVTSGTARDCSSLRYAMGILAAMWYGRWYR
jgi:hypothetical protein